MRRPAIVLVRLYQLLVSPLVPEGTCKFHPSCSCYAVDALRAHGFLRGTVLAAWRLLRCHPWSAGGIDRVDDQTLFRRTAAAPARRRV
jgi:putative membrane protein insertion efficiency factor